MTFTVLCFGDVVGNVGRQALAKALPNLKAIHQPDLVIANVENLAHGRGITAKTLEDLSRAGVDAFTSGHHVWENPLGIPLLKDPARRIVRPLNASADLAGTGWIRLDIHGHPVVLLNLQGRLFMTQDVSSPFLAFDRFWNDLPDGPDDQKPVVIVDFHAEATSEKNALGHYADGRATLLFGSHTHVPTADEKILSAGTGFQTDVGMTGSRDSVIGFEKNSSIKRFIENSTAPYELLDSGPVDINGLLAVIDPTSRKTVRLERVHEIVAT